MRWSQYFLHTTREVPSDAEVVSHRLMVRAGMLKKLAAGIYTYQPLAWRSLKKLMEIVRREMDAIGSHELAMPAVQPAGLWQDSGRWEKYGDELLRIKDRHQRDFCFGPTHEEVITDLVRGEVKSYRQLPVSMYQIQTKFRDEIRPRFGLMRGREFLMKDAYTFHADAASLDEGYADMAQAYRNIFEACQLDYTVVEADSGTIGGKKSQEFMVLADTGESVVVSCPECEYGANLERAESRLPPAPIGESRPLEKVETPGMTTVDEVAKFLEITPDQLVKTLLYETEKGTVAVVIRGDCAVNETKLLNHLDVLHLSLAGDETVRAATGAPPGFAGPIGLADDVTLVGDLSAQDRVGFVCGANEADAHFVGAQWGRDAEPEAWVDLREVREGEGCPRCDGSLRLTRGIEVGHIFQLGTVYSEPMGATFLDSEGQSHPMIMGCYGLGIGRTVAAAIEQNHDDDGIVWPLPLAPFQVLLAALNPNEEAVRSASETLYAELTEAGVEVLFDDRDERPGVKFKDADLVGIPIRIVVGARSLEDGNVELSLRSAARERQSVATGEIVARVLETLRQSSAA